MNASGDNSLDSGTAPTEDLDHAIRGGTRSVLLGQIVSQAVSFLVLGALYRLVSPDQFGLLGMAVPLLLLAKIFSSFGLSVATVQRRRLTDGQLSSVFWISLLVSVVVSGAMAVGGPVLAWLYSTPALGLLCPALAGTLVIAAAGAQHQALLERKLRIGRVTAARVTAQTVGGAAAIGAALSGLGVWALVIQQYVELVILALLVWGMEPWRPRLIGRGQAAGELVRFGGYYSLSSLMFFAAQNIDKVLIALLLGSTRQGQEALGMYTQAFNLMMKPVYVVTSPITGIMLPALSRLAHTRDAFADLAARFYRMVGILLIPAALGLAIVAVDVMAVLGGDAWRPAGYMLALLAPTILVQGFLNISGSLFAASGHPRRLFFGAAASALALTGGVVIGYWVGGRVDVAPWGPTFGVACAFSSCSVLLLFVPYTLFCFTTAKVSFVEVFRPLVKPALAAAVMAVLAYAARWSAVRLDVPALPRLLLVVIVGTLVYAALARREIVWLKTQLMGPSRRARRGPPGISVSPNPKSQIRNEFE